MNLPRTLSPGTVFAREYRIGERLSEGGMGAVYAAEQLSTGSARALKVMHPVMMFSPQASQRFVREARVGAGIESDHIVEIVDAGVDDETGMPWIAMELLRGVVLSQWLAARGRASTGETYEVFRQLCHALGLAHRKNVVHRDIKPENIFMTVPRTEGVPFTVKLLDFGIAKWLAEHQTSAVATGVLGSPRWMAPEQTDARGRISTATDVWALGLLAFQLLTGRYYWLGADDAELSLPALLRQVVLDPIESASVRAAQYQRAECIPAGFDAWFARCVERDAHARLRTASDAIEALVRVLRPPSRAPGPRAGSEEPPSELASTLRYGDAPRARSARPPQPSTPAASPQLASPSAPSPQFGTAPSASPQFASVPAASPQLASAPSPSAPAPTAADTSPAAQAAAQLAQMPLTRPGALVQDVASIRREVEPRTRVFGSPPGAIESHDAPAGPLQVEPAPGAQVPVTRPPAPPVWPNGSDRVVRARPLERTVEASVESVRAAQAAHALRASSPASSPPAPSPAEADQRDPGSLSPSARPPRRGARVALLVVALVLAALGSAAYVFRHALYDLFARSHPAPSEQSGAAPTSQASVAPQPAQTPGAPARVAADAAVASDASPAP